ncbi:hypothetical protein SAMN06265222_112109 [Neorhodopirellula lusitana]|uniref:Uncharacterized protein n=1 Tax=Neorhodopirellula lusitana TaxID=445327 RepID=A0ABY1QGE7_9BACT|nr:hypothetical protein [Neorhodopirellula lusitana]SMP69829.1 hypothetical protein SAMN06265222_112109 [Neorhodopirellula lusitana]
MAKSNTYLRRLRKSLTLAAILPISSFFAGSGILDSQQAMAIEGTELSGTVGVWAPLLPNVAGQDGDSIGTIIGLKGHHRFDGYRTSVEGGVQYGVTEDAEMFGFEFLLRDTWSFGIGDLSAGTGYSQMNWDQESRGHDLSSDYRGAKIVGGWETAFGNTPVWIDLSLGLYDMNGEYVGNGGATRESIDEFTTTWGIDVKTDTDMWGIPMRTVIGVNYLDDITTWQNGAIGTDSALVLTGALEFRLF